MLTRSIHSSPPLAAMMPHCVMVKNRFMSTRAALGAHVLGREKSFRNKFHQLKRHWYPHMGIPRNNTIKEQGIEKKLNKWIKLRLRQLKVGAMGQSWCYSNRRLPVVQTAASGRPPWDQEKPSFRANKLYFQGKKPSGLLRIHQRKSKRCQG